MQQLGKPLMLLGLLIIVFGAVLHFSPKGFPLGKLPGDIKIEKENFSFYFPLTSSIIVSVVVSGVLYLVSMFKK